MWLPIGWAKGPSSSSLLPYSANVKLTARLSALAVRKIQVVLSGPVVSVGYTRVARGQD